MAGSQVGSWIDLMRMHGTPKCRREVKFANLSANWPASELLARWRVSQLASSQLLSQLPHHKLQTNTRKSEGHTSKVKTAKYSEANSAELSQRSRKQNEGQLHESLRIVHRILTVRDLSKGPRPLCNCLRQALRPRWLDLPSQMP